MPNNNQIANRIIHLDLFSGIGGFAYAADQVWDNVEKAQEEESDG